MNAVALKVTIYINDKLIEKEIIKVSDTNIPFVDKQIITEKEVEQVVPPVRETPVHNFNTYLSGIENKANEIALQSLRNDYDNKLKIVEIQKDSAIQRLEDKIESLNDTILDQDKYIDELEGGVKS